MMSAKEKISHHVLTAAAEIDSAIKLVQGAMPSPIEIPVVGEIYLLRRRFAKVISFKDKTLVEFKFIAERLTNPSTIISWLHAEESWQEKFYDRSCCSLTLGQLEAMNCHLNDIKRRIGQERWR